MEDFVPVSACEQLRQRAEALVEAFDPSENVSVFSTKEQDRTSDEYFLASGDSIRCFFEPEAFRPSGDLGQSKDLSINKLGHAMHDLDPVFDAFSRTRELAELTEELGIAEPLLLQSMYIFKQPYIGGEVSLHTDQTFLWTDPPTVTGFWFAIQNATTENGCMWAVPGGHRQAPRKRFYRRAEGGTDFEVFDPEPYPMQGEVPLPARTGTLIVLDGLLPHRSGPNRSAHSRHAYTLHTIDASAHYRDDNWLRRGPDLPLRGFR